MTEGEGQDSMMVPICPRCGGVILYQMACVHYHTYGVQLTEDYYPQIDFSAEVWGEELEGETDESLTDYVMCDVCRAFWTPEELQQEYLEKGVGQGDG